VLNYNFPYGLFWVFCLCEPVFGYGIDRSDFVFSEKMSQIISKNKEPSSWKIIDNKIDFKPVSILESKTNLFNFIENDKSDLEIIRHHGEEIAFSFLREKYGSENVKWISKEKKYSDHDFEITELSTKKFIEVKSSKTKGMEMFSLSRNELNFYQKNKENYSLLFIWNIYENRKENLVPIYFLEKPNIEISMERVGLNIESRTLYLTPQNFIGHLLK
jgi:lipopolysaccharide export LptBFGC system permease protein LptF